MDQRELDDWCGFCEGTRSFPSMHFSRMFMEMFAKPLSERDQENLNAVFSYIPNSSKVLGNLLRIGTLEKDKNDHEITDLVIRDLKEMRHIIQNPQVLAAMDMGVSRIATDESQFWQARESALNIEFIESITDHIADLNDNEKIRELGYAFYGIANNLRLQYALIADLLGGEVNCDNYVELYMSGVDYALEETGAIVFKYRK